MGLIPQAGPETLQLEGHTGVRVEGASPGPCPIHHSAMKVEKIEQSPEESQDMMALKKELDHSAAEAEEGRPGVHSG